MKTNLKNKQPLILRLFLEREERIAFLKKQSGIIQQRYKNQKIQFGN